MKPIALLFMMIFTLGSFGQEETAKTPRIATKIALGETINYHGTMITFLEVLEDSRCPEDVVCVWAGQARVKLKVLTDTAEELLDLIVMKKDKDIVLLEEEFITRAIVLHPYPTTENMSKRDYELLIVREKLDQ